MTSEIVRFLEWDTNFFGHRIARIIPDHLTADEMAAALTWAAENTIDCLYFLVASDQQSTIRIAEDNGFRFVDIRVTFAHSLDTLPAPSSSGDVTFRLSRPDDLEPLRATAGSAYIHSRFYADPCFSEAQCNALYNAWLMRSLHESYADAVLVAEVDGTAVGYVTCGLDPETAEGTISLVGISEHMRGKQIGTNLVNYALNWFADHEMQTVHVVTQGRNIGAQRLYQHCGFLTHSVQLWYHKWLNNCPSSR